MKRFYEFDWDERNESHIAEHRVIADEVEQCFFNPYWLRKKPRSNRRHYLYGRTDGGKYLFIVFDDMGEAIARPVTAMDMDEREKSVYHQNVRS